MKKVVLASLLAVATSALSSMPAAFAQDPAAQSSQGTAANSITIKDPAEYNAYSNAIGQSSPAAKSSAIEAFLQQYPQSVVKNEMLEQLMAAYQQQQNTDKTLDAATRLLQVDPNNLRALTFYVYLKEAQAKQAAADPTKAQPLLDDAAAKAQQGLNATKPPAMAQADFDKLKAVTTPVFHSAVATAALAKKDYPTAITEFTAELKSYPDPTQTTTGPALNDTYLLGTAYVQQEQKDLPNGIWFLTRAAQYAPAGAAKDSIEQAAEYWYKKFHGADGRL